MEEISQREFSRRLDVSEATIRKSVAAGYISAGVRYKENGRPFIIYETALAEWNASPAGLQAAEKKIGKQSGGSFTVKTLSKSEQKGANTEIGTNNDAEKKVQLFDPALAETKKQILEEKQTSTKLENQRRAIELSRLVGALVDKEKVYNSLFEFGKALRESLYNISKRHISEIRNSPDDFTATQILDDAITESLRLLSSPPDLTAH